MRRPRLASLACVWALLACPAGCKKPDAIVCDPPINPTCPAVIPSFANDVYPHVFAQFCVSCHSSKGVESGTPLTTYQQIYGQNGSEAGEIFIQVYENCLMPPATAPAQLTDDQADGGDAASATTPGPRQTLLDWLTCQAPNN